MILYQQEKQVPIAEFIYMLESSGLALRRPMQDIDLLNRMILGSNLILTAREDGHIVGILRGVSDFCYRSFVADLAVIKSKQNQGIGKGLLQKARELAPQARLFLFSAEDVEGFYQRLGFELHERCYQLKTGVNFQ